MIILLAGTTRELEPKFFFRRSCFAHFSSSFTNVTKANGSSVGHFDRASCRTGYKNCSYINLTQTTTSALWSLEHLASRPNTHQVSQSTGEGSRASADKSTWLTSGLDDVNTWATIAQLKKCYSKDHHSKGWLISNLELLGHQEHNRTQKIKPFEKWFISAVYMMKWVHFCTTGHLSVNTHLLHLTKHLN